MKAQPQHLTLQMLTNVTDSNSCQVSIQLHTWLLINNPNPMLIRMTDRANDLPANSPANNAKASNCIIQ